MSSAASFRPRTGSGEGRTWYTAGAMAKKRKGKGKAKGEAPEPEEANVVSIAKKQAEKLVERVESLTDAIGRQIDEGVAEVLEHYRAWEEEHPEDAVARIDKMAMVRLGFIGPGGFDRCHETHRLPTDAFISEDDLGDAVLDDYVGAEELMCPAKEAGRCKKIWKEIGMPPCCLLLLEVNQGLGGGIWDERVGLILSELGRWHKPERYEDSFRAAERLKRKHKPK